MLGMMLALVLVSSPDEPPCDPVYGCTPDSSCRGACTGLNITAGVVQGGSVTYGSIHICDTMGQTCASSTEPHDPSSDCRQSKQNIDGCKVTIQPAQGLDWCDVCDCDDLVVACTGT